MSDSTQPARVRFAPSPTGFLHVGGLRTALFDWLYARHTGGQFILRIEDTDQKRFNPESMDDLTRSLHWMGLDWDEGPGVGGPYGPYIQSERQAIYQHYVEILIASGHAYRCYCTAEELDAMREEQRVDNRPQGYDRRHRYITEAERMRLVAEGRPAVVRLAAPLEGVTIVPDLLRGDISVENATILDPVLLKSDGMPTYHLAVVVDDHLMRITHVLRGEEWISSAPLHKLIHEAFGWEMPVLVHLPVILDPSGKGKMSKRKVVVAGKEYLALVHDFIDAGYLPEAMFNFLANVGWNFDPEREVFTREEAVGRFELTEITPTAAALPYSKLEWLNGVYIREMDPRELQQRLVPFLAKQLGLDEETLRTSEMLTKLTPLVQERIKLLTEAEDKVDWAFKRADEIVYSDPTMLIGRGMTATDTVAALEAGVRILRAVADFTTVALEAEFRAQADAMGLKVGSFFAPFRVAITGRTVSPPLFESIEALGREETIRRVENASQALRNYAAELVQ